LQTAGHAIVEILVVFAGPLADEADLRECLARGREGHEQSAAG
jgi:hypothetical protein